MVDDSSDGGETDQSAGESQAAVNAAGVPLRTLASRFKAAQHQAYLTRLEEALKEPDNRNIAVTGRYGTGKSSVLDKYVEDHAKTTLRLAISTLAPEGETKSVTNRLQKELVKQLLYSASPGTLKHSRFSRIAPLSKKRAALEAAVCVTGTWIFLALLGWLPAVQGAAPDDPWPLRTAAWVALGTLAGTVLMLIRLLTHDRFLVSDISAGGASVKLSARTATYFDEYLEEIVHFFDEEPYQTVVIEDLDRFNDPKIFEALRELNTLLNNTPTRLGSKEPLRFVYAVRDSLFERLGTEVPDDEADDAAVAETVRANRTKFFDVVIPLVPFISHRNARELLQGLLEDAHAGDISRRLIEVVAQHTTDMRLMINMRNEFLVFKDRLLDRGNSAPGLTPTHLFALVAYKNFHLEDFEQISRRQSNLDTLYDARRDLVREGVSQLERQKRDIASRRQRAASLAPIASRMGDRLTALGQAAIGMNHNGWNLRADVNGTRYKPEQFVEASFWDEVSKTNLVEIYAVSNPGLSGGTITLALDDKELVALFPEGLGGPGWVRLSADEARKQVDKIEGQIDILRGSDFHELATMNDHTTTFNQAELTFAQIIDNTLESDLARDLVKRGFIDRNFALYAAQFYGTFTGVDVATFIVQSVQTNTMDIDYPFASVGAIDNLLAEAGEDFTHTVSAFNTQVVDHLLSRGDERAQNVVRSLTGNFNEGAREFLGAYLTSGKQGPEMAASLAREGWRRVFRYLVSDDLVPDDVRAALISSALCTTDADAGYELDHDLALFLEQHYASMAAFTQAQSETTSSNIAALLSGCDASLSDLRVISEPLRPKVIDRSLYELTADNLRVAMGSDGDISLDRVCEYEVVYRYCLDHSQQYLEAAEADELTSNVVVSAETLASVTNDVAGSWDAEDFARLLALSDPDSALPTLADIPQTTWPSLATAHRIRPTLANIDAYRREDGVDQGLGDLLIAAGEILDDGLDDESVDATATAVAILNASETIPDPNTRVALVDSIGLEDHLTLDEVQPEASDLFALLLEHDLVADEAASFARFHGGGWAAIGPAISKSEHIRDFLAPEHLAGLIPQVFGTPEAADVVGSHILGNLAAFVADSEPEALLAAGGFAVRTGVLMPVEEITRIATSGSAARDTVLALVAANSTLTPEQIVSTLAALGDPYTYLSTRAQDKFDVPDDDSHRTVFSRLAEAGLSSDVKRRLQDVRSVTLD